jgi:hypothetical protein
MSPPSSASSKEFQASQATSAYSIIFNSIATLDVAPVVPILLGDWLLELDIATKPDQSNMHFSDVDMVHANLIDQIALILHHSILPKSKFCKSLSKFLLKAPVSLVHDEETHKHGHKEQEKESAQKK